MRSAYAYMWQTRAHFDSSLRRARSDETYDKRETRVKRYEKRVVRIHFCGSMGCLFAFDVD